MLQLGVKRASRVMDRLGMRYWFVQTRRPVGTTSFVGAPAELVRTPSKHGLLCLPRLLSIRNWDWEPWIPSFVDPARTVRVYPDLFAA